MGFVFTGIEQIIGEVRAGLWPCPWWLGGTPATTLGEVFQIQIFLLLIICRIPCVHCPADATNFRYSACWRAIAD